MTARLLEVDRISRRFGTATALDQVSFAARPGELFGLTGGRGAGKTTALRITLGVQPADSGAVRFDGRPIRRGLFGYLPEEGGLQPRMRVLDQLVHLGRLHGLSTNDAHGSAERWLARLGLGPQRKAQIRKLGAEARHRVRLAAALVSDPVVLVLDEPFTGLDPAAVTATCEVLREKAAAGVPVVLSSRRLDLVERHCDRVGVLRAGRMLAMGTIAELTGGAGRRLTVTAPRARPGWSTAVPGVRVLAEHRETTVLELSRGADDQAVLAAALATGPVTEFSHRLPSLAELFPDEVSAP
ncbi:ATP-binding cassette domain-containing protein [Amycolatopsis ultiminotia]|uniref:ATP-binding cassette domain-containing protein n=1 Tax=Amycolatopsis ultiminotia TaxID=543629 RepID=A0ABP6YLN2_9PSEU